MPDPDFDPRDLERDRPGRDSSERLDDILNNPVHRDRNRKPVIKDKGRQVDPHSPLSRKKGGANQGIDDDLRRKSNPNNPD